MHHDSPNERTTVTRRRAIFGVVTVLALGTTALVATPASADPAPLSGIVYDAGTAVMGADVTLYSYDPVSHAWQGVPHDVVTDANGEWSYDTSALPDGDYATYYKLDGTSVQYSTDQGWNGTADSEHLSTQFTITAGTPSTSTLSENLVRNAGVMSIHFVDNAGNPIASDGSSAYETFTFANGYNDNTGDFEGGISLYTANEGVTGTITQPRVAAATYTDGSASAYTYNGHGYQSYAFDLIAALTVTPGTTASATFVLQLNPADPVSNRPELAGYDPKLVGTLKAGELLTLDNPAVDGVTYDYQWYQSGVPILGASSQSLTLTPKQLGKSIDVFLYAHAAGQVASKWNVGDSSPVENGDPNSGSVAIIGSVKYGQTVSASVSTTLEGTSAFQWYLNGNAIDGATSDTYAIKPTDVGGALSVSVTSVVPGHTDAVIPSSSVVVEADAANTGTVAIIGTAKYGQTVSASVSTTLEGTPAFQWYLNGAPIAGASGSDYAIKSTDVGAALSVTVTSVVPGHADAAIPSAPVIVAAGDAATGSVAITGAARFGKTVTAAVSTAVAGTVSYQWFRNGVLVSGIGGSSYTIGKADLGSALTVVAKSTTQGRADAVLVSAPVTVAKDAAALKVSAAKKTTTKKALKVTVSVKPGASKIAATAKVKVYYSAKKFKTVTVKSGKSASVTLPRLSKGTHTIKVVYPGTASYAAKTVTFKVKVTK